MADVKWIKISTDIFDNWKIKTIKSMPEGHKMICIWVQLLCIAGTRNEHGMIIFPTQMCTTDDVLATVIGEDKLVVQMALEVFSKLGMIMVDDDNSMIQIANWEEYQSVDGLEKIRKDNAERQARFREKQKNLIGKNSNVTSNVTVTDSSYSYSYSNIIKDIINYLNNKLNTNYKTSTKTTIKHIKARLDEGFLLEDFISVIDFKYEQWGNDEKMKQYLRPETLFGTKFEGYLNSIPKKKEQPLPFEPVDIPKEEILEREEINYDDWVKLLEESEE